MRRQVLSRRLAEARYAYRMMRSVRPCSGHLARRRRLQQRRRLDGCRRERRRLTRPCELLRRVSGKGRWRKWLFGVNRCLLGLLGLMGLLGLLGERRSPNQGTSGRTCGECAQVRGRGFGGASLCYLAGAGTSLCRLASSGGIRAEDTVLLPGRATTAPALLGRRVAHRSSKGARAGQGWARVIFCSFMCHVHVVDCLGCVSRY